MGKRVILRATEFSPFTDEQKDVLADLEGEYKKRDAIFAELGHYGNEDLPPPVRKLIEADGKLDDLIETAFEGDENVFTLNPGREFDHLTHHILADLRSDTTEVWKFRQALDRGYEVLARYALTQEGGVTQIIKTPVPERFPRVAVEIDPPHDEYLGIDHVCIGVVLRAGIRPAIITGDAILQATGNTPTYAIFRISRNHAKKTELVWSVDDERTSYHPSDVEGRHLLLPDTMNAQGGTVIAVPRLLQQAGISVPKVTALSLIGAVEGFYNVINNATVPTRLCALRIDPVTNDIGYILPGLGDAGDRTVGNNQDITLYQMFKSFGIEFCNRYKMQVEAFAHAAQWKPEPDLFE